MAGGGIAMRIESLWQFPIKGLGGSTITSTSLTANRALPGDRRYALSTGSAKATSTADGVWLPKAHFLQLMQIEKLAELSCHEEDGYIVISRQAVPCFRGNLDTAEDAAALEKFIIDFLGRDKAAPMRLHRSGDGAVTDQSEPLVSIGGTASLAAFAAASKTRVDARRFRLNIMLHTETPFSEAELIGATLKIGTAVIDIVEPVGRCAAINVNPDNGHREPDHLGTMRHHFGHSDLGIFGRVRTAGTIAAGDRAIRID